jgi:hypothetical protein
MKFLYPRLGKLLLPVFLVIALNTSVKAQTSLVTGDLAFSGYVSNDVVPDQFSFVLLTNITATTVIRFCDFGWRPDLLQFNSGAGILESELVFTAGSAMNAGTEITIVGSTATIAGGGSAGTVVYTAGATFTSPLSLASTGDQLFAYQGSFAVPTFIAGIHMNVYTGAPSTTTAAAWDGVLAPIDFNNNNSGKPAALTTGTNANWFTTEWDNVRFICAAAPITTAAQARAALNSGNTTPANWITNNTSPSGFALPTGCNYLNILSAPVFTLHPPVSTTICEGAGTSFTITATGAITYQWQVDNGGGFANIVDNATYSGSTTVTLTITNAPASLNGYLYRCVATNGFGSTNSNNGTLTVTPLPINPTLLAKVPAAVSVADGTPVSATFNAGSGGSGGCIDDYRYTTNGGGSYTTYTPGTPISTTGLSAGTGYVFIEGRRAGCATCSGSYIVLAAWYVTPLPAGATTLSAGDIAFSGYTSTVTDAYSFVLLKNIGPGTVINFTDNGWLSTNVFGVGEQTATWTSNAAYPAGTEIIISGLTATLAAGGSAGTVTGSALSLSTTGDQVLAYQGLPATPTFISAIHMNVEAGSTAAAWDGAVVSNNASARPTGLTTGTNCIWIGTAGDLASEYENARYGTCASPGTLGPINTLRAALNNQANWIRDHSTPPGFSIPTGCQYFGLGTAPSFTLHPVASSVCEGTSTSFTVTANGAITYQWQVDNGGGFANLSNNATYSGVTTTTLNINATPLSLNGYLYRCVATNVSGSTNSNSALLTVTALPVSPTLLAKTPASNTVADGTPVSATFNAGSGGSGGCVDDFRYTVDGGTVYTAYTPGTNISTTGVAAGSGFVFIEGRRAGCATCSGSYTVLAAWRVTPLPVGATTLSAGDIAFSGYASTAVTDEFSFVLLKNIGPGTTINFTDNGWLSTNTFGVGETTVTWTAPAGGLPGGTEIKIAGLTATKSGPGAAGTVTGSALNLISTGDQVLAYQGAPGSPTFISAIHMNVEAGSTNAAWDGAVVSGNASALPTGLTSGVNCIWIGLPGDLSSEHNNAKYGLCNLPAISGSLVALRAALNNQSNWTVDDNTPPAFTLPTGCNYLSAVCETITRTSAVGTDAQTVCINTPITNITYSTSGATGATFSGLPPGVTGAWAANVVTISGSPTSTAGSPYNYTVTLTGGTCGGITATGSITVNPNNTITLTSAAGTDNQTVLINTPITNITYSTTGATGATFSGLPTGVTGNWAANVVTISGSPSVQGVFNYTVTLTGGCGVITANGTITVIVCSITRTSAAGTDAQSVCYNTPITNITYSTTGATGATFSGLPAGVTGAWAANVATISGSPTQYGIFSYTVTPTGGGCSGAVTATGTITINPDTWLGVTSTNWFVASNWSCGVPIATTDVTIPAGTPFSPVIAGGTAQVHNLTIQGGAILTNNATLNVNGGGTETNNGTYKGTGAFTGALFNNSGGIVAPGGSPGCASFGAGYTNGTGTEQIEIAGTTPCTQYDQLQVTGTATLSGTLNVTFFGGYTPNCGESYTIMTFTSRVGTFATVNTPALPAGMSWNITYNATTVVLSISGSPAGTATPASQTLCSGVPITTIVLTSNMINTNYTWSRDNNVTVTGIAASGSGNTISGTLTNTTNAPITVTFTITPTSGTCTGANFTATVTVNPTPVATVPSNTGYCNGTIVNTGTLNFTSNVAGTTFTWTNNNIAIGLGANGSGNSLPTFTATNGTNAPISGDITVTPTANGCPGAPQTFTITVNPIPNAVATPSSQTICSANAITTIVLTGNVAGTVYNWVRDNNATVTGITANGTGNISGSLTNTTNAPVTVTFTITPSYTNAGVTCTGTPITATVVVNPVPNAVATPSSQTICSANAITTIVLTGNVAGTVYNWVRDNNATATGIAASGAGNISGTLTNTTNVPVTVTFTITPGYTNAGVTCTGTPITATVVVNPVPNAVATPSSQTICSGSAITTIVLTGNVAGTVYNWVRDNNATATGIAASGAGNISGTLTNTTNVPVTVTFTITPGYTNAGVTCTGTPITATVVVNPVPNAVATPSSQTICSGSAITTIVLTGNVAGTVYNWVRDNNATVTGIAPSGAGNISGSLTNTTNAPVTVTFTITPGYTNAGLTCTGTPITATVVVNPVPNAVATPPSQTICSANAITTIVLTGNVAGTVYNWVRDNNPTVTGIPANGAGNIGGTLTNTTNTPVTVTFTITPSFTNAGVTCTGTPVTATVLVNPTPNAVATPGSQTICSGSAITTIVLTGNVAGTVYNWVRDNNATVTGIAAGGSGNISGSLTNTTNAPITVTFTITPTANGCTGPSITATVLVNPIPNAVATPASQTICSGSAITTIVLSGNVAGTVFNWTRDNTGIVTGIGASGSGDISGSLTNTTNAPVTVTFTITPGYTNGGVTCTGTPITATVLVNPTPNVVATPSSQTICSASSITTIVLSGGVAGTTYNWTRDNTIAVTGIAASGSGNISGALTNTTNAPVTVTFTITPTANGCPGAPITATVLVNPTPNAVATPSSQTICSASSITTIVLSGAVAGTTFNWTRDNIITVTGIASAGSGNISGSLTNTTNAPVTVTFTITPTANGCPGAPITATVLVNPTPDAVATPPSQTVCSGNPITTIVLSGNVAGTTFNWTRDNTVTVTGIGPSGSGNISGTLTNTTNAPVTVTFTITPTANGCAGAPITATVLVNPTPNAVATPASQTVCSGIPITTIVLSGAVAGTTFNWTRDNNVTVTGIGPSGSGNISGALTNTTNAPVTVTFTITPTANGCPGAPITATVLVNPTPTATAAPASQTICSGNTITTIVMSGTVAGTVFNWTRDNTVAVTGIANSGSGNISGALTNTTNAPVTVTFTITPVANGCSGTPITSTVLVNPTPIAVATPPSQTVCSGVPITTIVLSGPVAGTTYSWTRNNTVAATGIAASGTGNISGTLVNTTNAAVTVTFTITPSANSCTGAPITATVTVQAPLTIVCPSNIVINATAGTCGAVVNYPPATVTGTPAPVVTYSQASGSTFPVGVTTVTVTATNICGTVTCTFTITVLDVRVPVITTQPANRAVCVPGSATFSVVATNATSYQWQILNGLVWNNIPGATASSFTVSPTTVSMNGNSYRVAITGPCGTVVFSNPAILTVNPLPIVTLSSLSTPVLLPSRTVTITAATQPPGGSFAWLLNGAPMVGVTGPSLGPLTVNNIGRYNVIYTDLNGCVNTSADFIVSLEITNYLWVYPNPNAGQFNVRYYNVTGEHVTLKVFNGLGQEVYAQAITLGTGYSNILVNLGNAAAGVYVVKIMNGSGAELQAKRVLIAR